MSEKVKTNIVHLKHGNLTIYATDSQVAVIAGMRNEPDKRYNFVKVGGITFSPMDVAYIESRTRERYDMPHYFLERFDKEASSLIQIK